MTSPVPATPPDCPSPPPISSPTRALPSVCLPTGRPSHYTNYDNVRFCPNPSQPAALTVKKIEGLAAATFGLAVAEISDQVIVMAETLEKGTTKADTQFAAQNFPHQVQEVGIKKRCQELNTQLPNRGQVVLIGALFNDGGITTFNHAGGMILHICGEHMQNLTDYVTPGSLPLDASIHAGGIEYCDGPVRILPKVRQGSRNFHATCGLGYGDRLPTSPVIHDFREVRGGHLVIFSELAMRDISEGQIQEAMGRVERGPNFCERAATALAIWAKTRSGEATIGVVVKELK